MGDKHRIRQVVPIISTVVCMVLIIIFDFLGLFRPVDNALYDLSFRIRDVRKTDDRILIVAVDDRTLERFGRWPIRRTAYVPLINHLSEAKVIVFDIIFAESSDDDPLLAEAIGRRGSVILSSYIDSRNQIIRPVPSLGTAQVGHIHVEQDVDGVTRSVAHRLTTANGSIDSLASVAAAAVRANGVIGYDADDRPLPGRIRQHNLMMINFYGPPGTFPMISMADVVDGRFPTDFFREKIVLVGAAATGLDSDILVSSSGTDNRMSGVETQATILNNLIDGKTISVVSDGLRWFVIVLSCTGAFILLVRVSPVRAAFLWIGLLAILALVGFALLVWAGIWVQPSLFLLGLSLTFVGSYTFTITRMGGLLRSAKEDWEETFDSISDAIFIVGTEGTIQRQNRTATAVRNLDVSELLLKAGKGSYMEERHDPVTKRYQEIRILPRFDRSGINHGSVVIVKDITDRRKAEEEQKLLQSQLLQSQKMESVGRLAGGVAHDFNNMLSAILGFCELALQQRSVQGHLLEYLLSINEAGMKAKDLTTQLLAFSRKLVLEFKIIDLNSVVEGMAKILRRIIGEDIVLDIRTGQPTRHVKADRAQIEQIVLNLIVNARDAMPDGGRLIIETADVTLDGEYVHTHEGVKPGPYVLISISDTGAGMTREVQDRIFEPFFTTKEMEKGTGLGLATVYGIVKQHKGYIYVYSEPGRGTTFKIYLPASDGAVSEEASGEAPTALRRGAETILVVEDEPVILSLIATILTPLGYEVLVAANGEEALAICSGRREAIDLLITDVIMPGMNGRELAARLREVRPAIGVLYMSGHTYDVIGHHGVLDPGVVLLQKPFTPAMLMRKIVEVLDGSPGDAPPVGGT